jgi:hypothetical protein
MSRLFTRNQMTWYFRGSFLLAIGIYIHSFEALFVCFNVYLCNVQEEKVPPAVSYVFVFLSTWVHISWC